MSCLVFLSSFLPVACDLHLLHEMCIFFFTQNFILAHECLSRNDCSSYRICVNFKIDSDFRVLNCFVEKLGGGGGVRNQTPFFKTACTMLVLELKRPGEYGAFEFAGILYSKNLLISVGRVTVEVHTFCKETWHLNVVLI